MSLKDLCRILLLGYFAVILLGFSGFLIDSGLLATSPAGPHPYQGLSAAEASFARAVDEAMPNVYALPAVFLEELLEEALTSFASGNPAYAHVLCSHKDGVVTHLTGTGRHVTNFRKHENGRHYTKTFRQVLTNSGWVTYDVDYDSVSRDYCGCW